MLSIKARLALLTMISFAVLFGGSGFAIYYFAEVNLLERFDQRLRVQAYSIMTATYQKENRDVEVHFTDRFLQEFNRNQRKAFYQIWKDNGEVAERSDSMLGRDLPIKYGKEREPFYWNIVLPNGLQGRAIGVRFEPRVRGSEELENSDGFSLVLVVAKDLEEVESALTGLRNLLLIAGFSTWACSPFLVFLALSSGLVPLRGLVRRIETIDERSLETRFEERALPAELRPIARQLNQLIERLGVSFERERRFSADVAHELRTPIAGLRNIADVALKWSLDNPKKDFETIRSLSIQMERTVTQLLDLSRCDNDQLEIASESFDLKECVEEKWRLHKHLAAERGLEIDFGSSQSIVWRVDPKLMGCIIENLMENAVSYADGGTTIKVLATDDQKVFSIVNACQGIEAANLEKMFDRFWRSDAARSSELHSGLGLSIARAFAQKQGLRIEAVLTEENLLSMNIVNENASGDSS